jgi:hypothetical protein
MIGGLGGGHRQQRFSEASECFIQNAVDQWPERNPASSTPGTTPFILRALWNTAKLIEYLMKTMA